jgi:hypothetical protein
MSSTTGEIIPCVNRQVCANCQQLEGKLAQLSPGSGQSHPRASDQYINQLKQQLQEMVHVGQKCLDSFETISQFDASGPLHDENQRIHELELELLHVKEELKAEQQNKNEKNTDNQKAYIASLTAKLQRADEENLLLSREKSQREQLVRDYQDRLIQAETALKQKQEQVSVDPEQVVMLQAQLVFYKEDFETERKDRERAQARLADSEQQLAVARKQLQQYERQQMQSASQRRITMLALHRDEYNALHRTDAAAPLASRGVYQTDSPLPPEDGYDEIDCMDSRGTDCFTATQGIRRETDCVLSHSKGIDCHTATSDQRRRDHVSATWEVKPEVQSQRVGQIRGGRNEVLACPLCKKEFSIDFHSELLEHIENCSD